MKCRPMTRVGCPGVVLPTAPVESILLLDVLHYGEPAAQDTWLGRCASALKPGGVLIVREHDAKSRGTLAEWTEGLAVKLGWNRGHGFHPRKTIDLVRRLESRVRISPGFSRGEGASAPAGAPVRRRPAPRGEGFSPGRA